MRDDPEGLLALPEGWRYRVLFEPESTLSNGAKAPGNPDGMAAFEGRGGTTVLVRNHELEGGEDPAVEGERPYDSDGPGGTTALVVTPERRLIDSYVTSSGSSRNCAGGPTPWGTWLTCEETTEEPHGYVFEVIPDEEGSLARAPLRDMGRFSHEAAGVDPDTGLVYLTEDAGPSYLYRYTPDDRAGAPGSLAAGGTLDALALDEAGGDANELKTGSGYRERWVPVDPEDAHDEAEAGGALAFNRLEGAWFADGVLWFNDTEGGPEGRGQTWRYTAPSGTLELFFESGGTREMKHPDNATVTPWGDFFFVEDAPEGNRMMGITPGGRVYEFARNVSEGGQSELTGPCFSPDGRTLFVSYQASNLTFAIWGPWPSPSAARRARMARARPPRELAGHLTPEVAEASRAWGSPPLRTAALLRLGVPFLG